MINKKRLSRIKKELIKDIGKMAVIKFADGSELKFMGTTILEALVQLPEETEFTRAIRNKEIVSCSEFWLLVDVLLQLIDHTDK
ncbi:hypothetical protein KQH81_07045 [Clostridium cadaveris]|uniref:Uncharacterized protein n=1 Tax=Clostridium cadaveris TaxID=1529 RepID=A0A316M0F7_9CLOT|nr:hypothetical protein [Clostridium cadaveris]PWL52072.1 MAG: hypothetical protein DBY38_12185 [Clostridium cadaveris]UFH65065.1 hypothetical protein KQH81_00365 [Clostridium cadaveris]UFH66269.1 hypothetical protein KQH81_07045 [Clostridium cadaveris]